ncbi:MAG: hypothetical protein KDB79_11375, partial [Acidobacteria bacterium]|nr:hypothetical protein [Acidobacteriota bacterium]
MTQSRRTFLTRAGASASILLAPSFPSSVFPADGKTHRTKAKSYEMLVLGDSVTWGQGNSDENKFAFKVARWIESNYPAGNTNVNLTMRAHSGATIVTNPEEFDSQIYRDRDPLKRYDGEVNISTPVMTDQAIQAAKQYRRIGVEPSEIGLVLLNGGINDMGAQRIVDPDWSGDSAHIKTFARQHCYHSMKKLLKHVSGIYRNAVIVVPGYYPLFSESSDCGSALDLIHGFFGIRTFDWIKILCRIGTPDPQKMLVDLRTRLSKRSTVWYQSSTEELGKAVSEFNAADTLNNRLAEGESPRFHFVKIPFESENCFAAPDTYLWSKPIDPKANARETICKSAIDDLYRRLTR